MELRSCAFARMHNLRLLKIYNSGVGINCKVQLHHGLDYISDELRYLHWNGYPLRSLPCNFQPENLVQLDLSFSKVVNLWTGVQDLVNLKEINLGNCEQLVAIPDLQLAKNLESLKLHFCRSLEEVPSSIQCLDKLSELDMRYCKSLHILPSSFNLTSLKTLKLSGCSNLRECPELSRHISYLNLSETTIAELPQSIQHLTGLVLLNLKDCKELKNLPDCICLLKSLETLDLSGCSKIVSLPNVSESIKFLYLSETAVQELPSSISGLSSLCELDLMNCTRLKRLRSTICKLTSLRKLILSGCPIMKVPSSVQCLSRLDELHMRNCKTLETLPSSICKLKSLEYLDLSGCSRLESLPLIPPNLGYLYLEGTALRELPSGLDTLRSLESGNLKNLVKLTELTNARHLRKLDLNGCKILQIPEFFCYIYTLELLDLSGNDFETLPANITMMTELKYLFLMDCKRLRSLPQLPPKLTKLDANNCVLLARVLQCSAVFVPEGNIFGFHFTNCFLLNENARRNIVEYALIKFHCYAERLSDKFSIVPPRTSTVYFPGREVPHWFHHQTWGSSVAIQVPLHLGDNMFLGFALCAVVTFDHYMDECGFQLKCEYHFKSDYGHCHNLCCYVEGWYPAKRRRHLRSDHVFLGYDPCSDAAKYNLFSKYCCNEATIKFFPEDMDNDPLHCCKVIKCGVRLVYAADANSYFSRVIQPRFRSWDHDRHMATPPETSEIGSL